MYIYLELDTFNINLILISSSKNFLVMCPHFRTHILIYTDQYFIPWCISFLLFTGIQGNPFAGNFKTKLMRYASLIHIFYTQNHELHQRKAKD